MKEKIELNSFALFLRKKIGEDSLSPIDIFSVIENIPNLTLVFYPMSNKISGMCIRTDVDGDLIAINSNLSYGRQRFTAAHELYHLNFQENFQRIVCGRDLNNVKDDEEKNADAFASYFLVPYDALKMFINEERHNIPSRPITLKSVVRFEQHYGMSRQAALVRLQSEGYISYSESQIMIKDVKLSARLYGYSDRLYVSTSIEKQYSTVGNYIELVEQLKEKGTISQGKYEEYLLEAYRSDIIYNLNTDGEEIYD